MIEGAVFCIIKKEKEEKMGEGRRKDRLSSYNLNIIEELT